MTIPVTSPVSATPCSLASPSLEVSHSTPCAREEPHSLDPSLGETLMEDIRHFIRAQGGGGKVQGKEGEVQQLHSDGEEDSEEWTDEEEEEEEVSTLREEEGEVSIGRDWRERIQPLVRQLSVSLHNAHCNAQCTLQLHRVIH